MRAVVLEKFGPPEEALQLREVPDPAPGPGQAQVRLRAAALNHRDTFIRQKLYARIQLPAILGSDGAGEVVAVGEGVDPGLRGKRVLVIPCTGWGADERAQGKDFVILGMPEQGTLAELISRPADRFVEMPAHLDSAQGAALPLAGLTAYRALTARGGLQPGEHVLVTGIGGGVATMALLLAKALGAQVSATSGSEEKLARARALGAISAVSYKDPDWPKRLVAEAGRAPSLIIDGTGGPQVNQLIAAAASGARLVFYGATAGKPDALDMPRIFFKQLDLRGTTMGSDADFRALVELVARAKIEPLVDRVFPLAQAAQAMQRMDEAQQMGKIVLSID
jgi:NADPH:quinone reductase-like Zn-dependent oxidoreductase